VQTSLMVNPPSRGNRQRGNTLLVVLIALTGLAALGSLTVVSVQSGLSTATSERAHDVALYAAESGAMVAMDYLREVVNQFASRSSAVISPDNSPLQVPPGMPGNEALPGQPDNVFSADMQAWYRVTILNNVTDPRFTQGADPDGDGRLTIRSAGFGPDGATATVEVDVEGYGPGEQLNILAWREVP
jgi:Tfp pilus assembly protein PilX